MNANELTKNREAAKCRVTTSGDEARFDTAAGVRVAGRNNTRGMPGASTFLALYTKR